MNKLGKISLLAAVLLALSMSDVSKYCRHQLIDWKFRASRLEASVAAPVPDTVVYDYADDPDIMEYVSVDEALPHGEGILLEDIDPELLTQAIARMDSADVPKPLTWDMLKDVKYKKRYNKDYDQYFDYPVFGEKVTALDGQKVSIKGYIIPLDVGLYALSKNPYASCFFCGGAGPETISGLTFAKLPKRYKTDEFLTLQGIFRLNSTDVNKFMYQIYAVEAVK